MATVVGSEGSDSAVDVGAGAAGGDVGGESSPASSSSNGVSFSLETFPLRSFDRLFWNQTYVIGKTEVLQEGW